MIKTIKTFNDEFELCMATLWPITSNKYIGKVNTRFRLGTCST